MNVSRGARVCLRVRGTDEGTVRALGGLTDGLGKMDALALGRAQAAGFDSDEERDQKEQVRPRAPRISGSTRQFVCLVCPVKRRCVRL